MGSKGTANVLLGIRLGDWVWRSRGRGKVLLLAYLLPWPESFFFFFLIFRFLVYISRKQSLGISMKAKVLFGSCWDYLEASMDFS